MIVDTSALIAILKEEPDAGRYVVALAEAPKVRLSAGSYLETAIVVDSNGDPVLSGRLDQLLAAAEAKIEPVTPAQAELARRAYRDFGRRSGHRAKLNFGDCFAYALAKDTGEALLFKGQDFVYTDLPATIPQTPAMMGDRANS
ncbi:MAG TPA: type II toxin-antitoxin system VapC family toxin [Acidimicrobiales bacterium]|nr:type II toxin-antitoxin system VapC family toxin [Acidimicrobiales bacterium]